MLQTEWLTAVDDDGEWVLDPPLPDGARFRGNLRDLFQKAHDYGWTYPEGTEKATGENGSSQGSRKAPLATKYSAGLEGKPGGQDLVPD